MQSKNLSRKLKSYINWGKYYAEQVQEVVKDGTLEDDTENKKRKKQTVYIREQMKDVVEIDFSRFHLSQMETSISML